MRGRRPPAEMRRKPAPTRKPTSRRTASRAATLPPHPRHGCQRSATHSTGTQSRISPYRQQKSSARRRSGRPPNGTDPADRCRTTLQRSLRRSRVVYGLASSRCAAASRWARRRRWSPRLQHCCRSRAGSSSGLRLAPSNQCDFDVARCTVLHRFSSAQRTLPDAHWPAADRQEIPDDRNRYEIIDGELFMTPSPSWGHQRLTRELLRLIDDYLRTHRLGEVLSAPADVTLADDTVVEPDIFVVPLVEGRQPRSWADVRRLLLLIEILSSGTAHADRTVKRRRYQREGVPEYWIADGDARLVER